MSRPRVATIGAGYFSQFHYDAWRRLPVDVVGVCDLDEGRAAAIAAGFPDHMLHGTPLANSAADYLDNMRVVEAVYRSAETGTWVTP